MRSMKSAKIWEDGAKLRQRRKKERRNKSFIHLYKLFDNYNSKPTPENYIALRRYAPNADIEIAQAAEIDPLRVAGDALKSAGIDASIVRGALGGGDRDIDQLCLRLI